MVKVGQLHRRLDASEASSGGEPRVFVSGDQTAGGGHLCDAGGLVRRVVQALGAGVAGVVAGVDLGGRRSSGRSGLALGGTAGRTGGRARLLEGC